MAPGRLAVSVAAHFWLLANAAQPLKPLRWDRLPVGSVLPRGWLANQSAQQAGGLTSHLPLFWDRVANTSWLGGHSDNDGGLHESTPYWLNGATPLAFQVKDEALMGLVNKYITGILDRQQEDGWLGPDTNKGDYWSRFPVVLALVQYHEAIAEGPFRQRLLQATVKFFAAMKQRLDEGVTLAGWSAARSHDLIWAVHYVADVLAAAPEPGGSGALAIGAQDLLAFAEALHTGGYDWHGAWFNSTAFPKEEPKQHTLWTHGVNNAQAVKFGAVWARQSDDAGASVAQSKNAWEVLMKYHGQPNGIFAADEHLAGRDPSRGSELCMVVEAMWSLNLLAQASLNDHDACAALDAVEALAFNALPGSLSADLWSHPYLQFANSFQAIRGEQPHPWKSDGPDAAMYGLVPNYECCTANFHQGYPKFIANLFYSLPAEGTLISAVWAPSFLNASSIGGGAEVELRTDYPFGTSVDYVVRNPEAFKLKVRLPAFLRAVEGPSKGLATVRAFVEGHERTVELVDGFLSYDLPAWGLPEPRVALRIQWQVVPEPRVSDVPEVQGTSIYLGPLLLALDLNEERQLLRQYPYEAADWNTTTKKEWRYALGNGGNASAAFGAATWREPGSKPYARGEGCPISVPARMIKLSPEQWPGASGGPGKLPGGGFAGDSQCSLEEVLLLPYGCTSIRISAFPERPDSLLRGPVFM